MGRSVELHLVSDVADATHVDDSRICLLSARRQGQNLSQVLTSRRRVARKLGLILFNPICGFKW